MAEEKLSVQLNKNILSMSYHFGDDVIFGNKAEINIRNIPSAGIFFVTQEMQYSPSKISFALYGDEQYDWIIMLYNGLSRDDLFMGCMINVPDLNYVQSYLAL